MVVKFFSSKSGGGIPAIKYLLRKDRVENGTARILSGDEKLTIEILKSLTQKHKACVGCLSFEEKTIPEDTKKELIESFENALLTPEMRGRYNILWVEHSDKGRVELNFVIPKIDLESKLAFNPYFHPTDCKRIDLWGDYVNYSYGFSDPKNPAKENSLQGSKKQYELIKDYQELDNLLQAEVKAGRIVSRADIIEFCQENSIEVTRTGEDYLSLKLPESQKAKRFKGGIYNEKFRSIGSLEELHREQSERERVYNQQDNAEILRKLEREFKREFERKSEFYARKHQDRARKIHKQDYYKDFGKSPESGKQLDNNQKQPIQIQNLFSDSLIHYGGDNRGRSNLDFQVKKDNKDDEIRAEIVRRSRENSERARAIIEARNRTNEIVRRSREELERREREKQENRARIRTRLQTDNRENEERLRQSVANSRTSESTRISRVRAIISNQIERIRERVKEIAKTMIKTISRPQKQTNRDFGMEM